MSTEAEIQAENDRAIQAWLNRPRRRVALPSPRKPDTSWHSNHADLIERQLLEDGHRTWGFVIYRTTFGNDEDWAEFLTRLQFRMEDAFEFFNGQDILELFTLTVIEDRENLEGASTAVIREHFRSWCVVAPRSEQQRGDASGEIGTGLSPRYRYAVQVDAASLSSVLHDAPTPPDPDSTKRGWVKLIDASWRPRAGERIRNSFEPVEGVTEKDVGWMKVPYQSVMEEFYVRCRDLNWWVTGYQRPPAVVGYPYDG